MKKLLLIVIVAGLGYGVYWYGDRAGWFIDTSPSNPPTKEDLERIDAVEEAASTISPDAKAGAGVRPKGSTPPAPIPTPVVDPEDSNE